MDKAELRSRNADFAKILEPLARIVASIPCDNSRAARAALEQRAPIAGELVASIRAAAERGISEGWLVYKGEPGLLFGRVAKDLLGFSVDAVLMDKAGPRHRHPKGEYDLCLATAGQAKFDGQDQGWVVYPPNSVHVPTVTDGEMLILYFLPGGAFELLPE